MKILFEKKKKKSSVAHETFNFFRVVAVVERVLEKRVSLEVFLELPH